MLKLEGKHWEVGYLQNLKACLPEYLLMTVVILTYVHTLIRLPPGGVLNSTPRSVGQTSKVSELRTRRKNWETTIWEVLRKLATKFSGALDWTPKRKRALMEKLLKSNLYYLSKLSLYYLDNSIIPGSPLPISSPSSYEDRRGRGCCFPRMPAWTGSSVGFGVKGQFAILPFWAARSSISHKAFQKHPLYQRERWRLQGSQWAGECSSARHNFPLGCPSRPFLSVYEWSSQGRPVGSCRPLASESRMPSLHRLCPSCHRAYLAAEALAPEQMVFTLQVPRARREASVTGRCGTRDPLPIKYGQQPRWTRGDEERGCLLPRTGAESDVAHKASRLSFQSLFPQRWLLPPTSRREPVRTSVDQKIDGSHRPGTQDGDLPEAADSAHPCQRAGGTSISRCSSRDAGLQGFSSRTSYEQGGKAAISHPCWPGGQPGPGQRLGMCRPGFIHQDPHFLVP